MCTIAKSNKYTKHTHTHHTCDTWNWKRSDKPIICASKWLKKKNGEKKSETQVENKYGDCVVVFDIARHSFCTYLLHNTIVQYVGKGITHKHCTIAFYLFNTPFKQIQLPCWGQCHLKPITVHRSHHIHHYSRNRACRTFFTKMS